MGKLQVVVGAEVEQWRVLADGSKIMKEPVSSYSAAPLFQFETFSI
jgi:hypothetical protein